MEGIDNNYRSLGHPAQGGPTEVGKSWVGRVIGWIKGGKVKILKV